MKKYLLLILLVGAGIVSGVAQPMKPQKSHIVGDFEVKRRALEVVDNQLNVVLDIYVSPNAVTRSTSWMIMPVLHVEGSDKVQILPHIVLEGRYQKHIRLRHEKFSPGWVNRKPYRVVDVRRRSKEEKIDYRVSIPYEPWMDKATLRIEQIQVMPGDKRRVFAVDVNGAVEHR